MVFHVENYNSGFISHRDINGEMYPCSVYQVSYERKIDSLVLLHLLCCMEHSQRNYFHYCKRRSASVLI
jgi:hypothetical protein